MGKHDGNRQEPTQEDRDRFHTDVRSLPTHKSDTAYDKYAAKPLPADDKKGK